MMRSMVPKRLASLPGSSPDDHTCDVLVVGGGSVGLSLTAELGWRGIRTLLVEQSQGLNPHPRANAVANRTMEYYRRWHIDEQITEAGIKNNGLI